MISPLGWNNQNAELDKKRWQKRCDEQTTTKLNGTNVKKEQKHGKKKKNNKKKCERSIDNRSGVVAFSRHRWAFVRVNAHLFLIILSHMNGGEWRARAHTHILYSTQNDDNHPSLPADTYLRTIETDTCHEFTRGGRWRGMVRATSDVFMFSLCLYGYVCVSVWILIT